MRVLFERNVSGTMRDGTILRANLFRPEADGVYPVVLTRLPYGKDTSYAYLILDPVRLAEAGYIVVIQDVRGRYASEGSYGGFSQEYADGYDTVEWASQLRGSNGSVGMYGASYFAYTQLAAAASGHPALKTITPTVSFDDAWAGVQFRGGALEWGMTCAWYLGLMAPTELARSGQGDPAFPAQFGRLVHDIDHLAGDGYFQLPLAEFAPLKRLGILPEVFDHIRANTNSDYWRTMSIRGHYEAFHVSAQFTGGWYDVFLKSTIESFLRMREAGKDATLTIGPWTHSNQSHAVGDVNFGLAANSMLLNFQDDPTTRHQRWFDAKLKDVVSGLDSEPPVRIFVMGTNRWRSEPTWPLTDTQFTPFYLHSGGDANRQSGDGKLDTQIPATEAPDNYVYNPADPVRTHGGNLLMTSEFPPGPKAQELPENRADVLVFTSAVLSENLEVTGPIQAKLWVASSARDTDFVVRLADVDAHGQSINLADGILRMRYRNSEQHPQLMEPGTVYAIVVDCWATSNVFLAGHRIRVQVTSSNFPRWSRNLNTGDSNEETIEFQSANQTLYHDEEHPSHILLPIIPQPRIQA